MKTPPPPPRSREQAHVSVMPTEMMAAIEPRAGGVYVDATLGAGGHSLAILRLNWPRPGGRFGVDRDLPRSS